MRARSSNSETSAAANRTRLVLRGHDEAWLRSGGLVELEPEEGSELSRGALARVRGRAVLLIRARRDLEAAREACERLEPVCVVLWFSPTALLAFDPGELSAEIRRWLPHDCPIHLDARDSEDSPAWVRDPLWRRASAKAGGYWRIHGWNESRWVRRYGEADLEWLAQSVIRVRPDFLSFAHSQRVEQIREFSLRLERAQADSRSAAGGSKARG